MTSGQPPEAHGSDLDEFVRAASFIFAGTVVESGSSNVHIVEPRATLLLVRVDRALRVDPAIGNIQRRLVTVDARDPKALPLGSRAVFFARSWIHGEELAVHELAHVDVDRVDDVEAAVARLPELHLTDRLEGADVVVHAEVEQTNDLTGLPLERRAPKWSEATLRIESTLKGQSSGLRLLFPTSTSHHWYRAPRLRRGQRAIFILREDDPQAGRWGRAAARHEHERVVTALDPADVQPESELAQIRALIGASRG